MASEKKVRFAEEIKKVNSLPSRDDLLSQFAIAIDVIPQTAHYLGEQTRLHFQRLLSALSSQMPIESDDMMIKTVIEAIHKTYPDRHPAQIRFFKDKSAGYASMEQISSCKNVSRCISLGLACLVAAVASLHIALTKPFAMSLLFSQSLLTLGVLCFVATGYCGYRAIRSFLQVRAFEATRKLMETCSKALDNPDELTRSRSSIGTHMYTYAETDLAKLLDGDPLMNWTPE